MQLLNGEGVHAARGAKVVWRDADAVLLCVKPPEAVPHSCTCATSFSALPLKGPQLAEKAQEARSIVKPCTPTVSPSILDYVSRHSLYAQYQQGSMSARHHSYTCGLQRMHASLMHSYVMHKLDSGVSGVSASAAPSPNLARVSSWATAVRA